MLFSVISKTQIKEHIKHEHTFTGCTHEHIETRQNISWTQPAHVKSKRQNTSMNNQAGGWSHAFRLQHPEGEHFTLGAASPWGPVTSCNGIIPSPLLAADLLLLLLLLVVVVVVFALVCLLICLFVCLFVWSFFFCYCLLASLFVWLVLCLWFISFVMSWSFHCFNTYHYVPITIIITTYTTITTTYKTCWFFVVWSWTQ